MRIRWFGQSAFLLTGSVRVAIDPFGDIKAVGSQRRFDYPLISEDADLLLITHEHFDHNEAGAIGGDPQVIRSTAGTFDSPVGEVRAIASEHDEVAGTQRGPNAIIVFGLDGLRLCHFGDFGQGALRPEQRAAIGDVDVLMLPVGGGPTVGGEPAAAIVRASRAAARDPDALPHRRDRLPRSAGRVPRRLRRRRHPHARHLRGRGGGAARLPSEAGHRGLDAAALAADAPPRLLRGRTYEGFRPAGARRRAGTRTCGRCTRSG